MSEPEPELDDERILDELSMIAGGNLTEDSVGPDHYAAIVARARAHAERYLDLAESLYLTEPFDARAHSNIRVANLLRMVRDQQPDRAHYLAEQLLDRIEAVTAEATAETFAEAGPDEAARILTRLEQRRAILRDLTTTD